MNSPYFLPTAANHPHQTLDADMCSASTDSDAHEQGADASPVSELQSPVQNESVHEAPDLGESLAVCPIGVCSCRARFVFFLIFHFKLLRTAV
jgi:hypothetical protein